MTDYISPTAASNYIHLGAALAVVIAATQWGLDARWAWTLLAAIALVGIVAAHILSARDRRCHHVIRWDWFEGKPSRLCALDLGHSGEHVDRDGYVKEES